MFKKTQPTQGDLFKSISHQVSGRKSQILEDPPSWHNVFYDQVTRQIDEDVFSVLYYKGNGRPNASIRKMKVMMNLKECNGWSDQQLMADRPPGDRTERANVQEHIHQVFHRSKKGKKSQMLQKVSKPLLCFELGHMNQFPSISKEKGGKLACI